MSKSIRLTLIAIYDIPPVDIAASYVGGLGGAGPGLKGIVLARLIINRTSLNLVLWGEGYLLRTTKYYRQQRIVTKSLVRDGAWT